MLVWSEARAQRDRIVTDLAERFAVLAEVEVVWTPGEHFAESLSRMYGDSLPPGSDKELHCGTGPFLLVVVEDAAPRYRLRRTNRGHQWLNSRIFDARSTYRSWSGGGYRVHASDSVLEAERNLVLLLDRHASEFLGSRRGPGARGTAGDPIGAGGTWRSREQLVRALEAYGAVPAVGAHDDTVLQVEADDAWWVERILGGDEVGEGLRRVTVSGQPLTVAVRQAAVRPPTRRQQWSKGALAVVALLSTGGVDRALVQRKLEGLRRVDWSYARPRSTAAVHAVCLTSTLLARRALPPRWRPEGLAPVLAASGSAYVVVRTGSYKGWSKRFKHSVLDWFEGDVDDAQTWLLAGSASAAVLAGVSWLRRVGRGSVR